LLHEAVRAAWPLTEVYVEDASAIDVSGVDVRLVSPGVIERVATTVTPRPVLAVARQRIALLESLRDATFVLVLVDVADPGNLGTMIRTAESAGVDAVVVCGGVDVFNPKCVRASAGSLFFVPIVRCPDAVAALDQLGAWGLRRLGTSSSAPTRYDEIDLRSRVALVLGSEAHGLEGDVRGAVDGMVSIPIAGRSESLNVAAAAAVICFEVTRQRRPS
ncbi:MAG TPA: RNA methyltransferase, partial [Acidimicrobiales bacterium]|nr:RNA methyltransferase [Acidimicrobiales bacterium]